LGGGESGANGRDSQWPGHVPGAPGEMRLEAASFEALGTGAELVPLAVSLSVPLGFFGAAGRSPIVRQQRCPT
jgi:hypothetical protein